MFPNEATYLYDWNHSSKISYGDFIRAKQFERSMRYAIDDQTKQLIATNSELAQHGIEVISDDLKQGFSILSEGLGRVTDAIERGNEQIITTLNWGFSEVLGSLSRMNDSLKHLVSLARTPSQTWSYEQFEIARDEFRRGLYPEALDSVCRAINGHGSNAGYKTEFRFHFLLGTIKLGSYKNSSPDIVSPKDAEEAFLAAARYASSDYPDEAGRAFVCAGRACYLQNKLANAIQYTNNGLSLLPSNADGIYQLARLLFIDGQPQKATKALTSAIEFNVDFAIRAGSDIDFLTKKDWLEASLGEVLLKYRKRYEVIVERLNKSMRDCENYVFYAVDARSLIADKFTEIRNAKQLSEKHATNGTLFGYKTAINQLVSTFSLFPKYFEEFRLRFLQHHNRELASRVQVPKEELLIGAAFGMGAVVALMTCVVLVVHDIFSGARYAWVHEPVFTDLFGKGTVVGIITTVGIIICNSYSVQKFRSDQDWRAKLSNEVKAMNAQECPKDWNVDASE